MSQMRWNPFREIEEMLDRYTRSLGSGAAASPTASGGRESLARPDWIPAVDIIEKKDNYLLKVELPEVKKEDVKVNLDNGVLTISGERRLELEEGEEGSPQHRLERVYGSFSRSFTLPAEADAEAIDATYRDGMLTLMIPKSAQPEPKAIEVKVH